MRYAAAMRRFAPAGASTAPAAVPPITDPFGQAIRRDSRRRYQPKSLLLARFLADRRSAGGGSAPQPDGGDVDPVLLDVHALWIAARGRRPAPEPLDLLVGQRQLGGGQQVLELLEGARPDDRRGDARLGQKPGERHLRNARAQ